MRSPVRRHPAKSPRRRAGCCACTDQPSSRNSSPEPGDLPSPRRVEDGVRVDVDLNAVFASSMPRRGPAELTGLRHRVGAAPGPGAGTFSRCVDDDGRIEAEPEIGNHQLEKHPVEIECELLPVASSNPPAARWAENARVTDHDVETSELADRGLDRF